MSEEEVAFEKFEKIPRLSRDCVVTEKLDGTNAQIYIGADGSFKTGSRNRWITPDDDNYGFSRWAHEHKDELVEGLGVGRHFGEWWGLGIQRGYGLDEKVFSLFNVARWNAENIPGCVSVVPVLYEGLFDHLFLDSFLSALKTTGSVAAPGYDRPEGIVCFHKAANQLFKKTIEDDAAPKSVAA